MSSFQQITMVNVWLVENKLADEYTYFGTIVIRPPRPPFVPLESLNVGDGSDGEAKAKSEEEMLTRK